jgi:multiple sugar transport system permease protein
VRPSDPLKPPEGVDVDRWNQLQPKLAQLARAAMASLPPVKGVRDEDEASLRDAGVNEAVRHGVAQLNSNLWSSQNGDAEIINAFRSTLTPANLATLLDDRLARLELTGIQVRSLTGHVVQAGELGKPDNWRVVSGDADLVALGGSRLMVRYRFKDASAAPVVLQCDFDAGVTPAELHRLIVSYTGDSSWHRFDVDLQLGDQIYKSIQSTYIAQSRAASLLLQPPTFQDETLGPRLWVDLRPVGHAASASPTRASLRLKLSPSSTLRAVYGKLVRNYTRAFRSVPFWTYLFNSVVLVVLQMAGALFSAGCVGYAFARLNWPGRSVAMTILLGTMVIPSQVTMIPSFLIWRSIGWYNTLNPLWVTAWLGNAFFIFLMVQQMRTIPRELDEAARIDGMNPAQTWWYVIMPQVKPTLAAIAIMTFMGAWNDFMGPLIMLRDQAKFPLSLGLFSMRLDAADDWPLIMAGNMLMTLPVILIFFNFQRHFLESVTGTGIKA